MILTLNEKVKLQYMNRHKPKKYIRHDVWCPHLKHIQAGQGWIFFFNHVCVTAVPTSQLSVEVHGSRSLSVDESSWRPAAATRVQ